MWAHLMKEAVHRITGLPWSASFLATTFALGVLADALRRTAAPLLKVFRPGWPSFASTAMFTAVVRYALRGIGGSHVSDTPFAGTMIALGLCGPGLRLVALPVHLFRAAVAAVDRVWQ